jgi:hypothetical protein
MKRAATFLHPGRGLTVDRWRILRTLHEARHIYV